MIESAWNADPTLARATAGHEHRVGAGELAVRARQRRLSVEEPLLVHAVRAVLHDARFLCARLRCTTGCRPLSSRGTDCRCVRARAIRPQCSPDRRRRRCGRRTRRFRGSHVLTSKQPPPPWKNTSSFSGSPLRIQNAYLPPRAQRVWPPGSTRCQSAAAGRCRPRRHPLTARGRGARALAARVASASRIF